MNSVFPVLGHYTGKPLTPQSLVSLHLLLWDKAGKHFEVNWTGLSTFKLSILNSQLRNTDSLCQAKNYVEALQWYNYSLSFYKAGQMEPNLAKLQRNRASCLLLLKQLDKVMARGTQSRPGNQPFPLNLTSQPPFCIAFFAFSWSVNKDTIYNIKK